MACYGSKTEEEKTKSGAITIIRNIIARNNDTTSTLNRAHQISRKDIIFISNEQFQSASVYFRTENTCRGFECCS